MLDLFFDGHPVPMPAVREYTSLLRQLLRWVDMSLESCPTCGYALSTIGNHCRHCPPAFLASSGKPFDAKQLSQIIAVLAILSVFGYLMFCC